MLLLQGLEQGSIQWGVSAGPVFVAASAVLLSRSKYAFSPPDYDGRESSAAELMIIHATSCPLDQQAAYVQQNPNWSVLSANFEQLGAEIFRQVRLQRA